MLRLIGRIALAVLAVAVYSVARPGPIMAETACVTCVDNGLYAVCANGGDGVMHCQSFQTCTMAGCYDNCANQPGPQNCTPEPYFATAAFGADGASASMRVSDHDQDHLESDCGGRVVAKSYSLETRAAVRHATQRIVL